MKKYWKIRNITFFLNEHHLTQKYYFKNIILFKNNLRRGNKKINCATIIYISFSFYIYFHFFSLLNYKFFSHKKKESESKNKKTPSIKSMNALIFATVVCLGIAIFLFLHSIFLSLSLSLYIPSHGILFLLRRLNCHDPRLELHYRHCQVHFCLHSICYT